MAGDRGRGGRSGGGRGGGRSDQTPQRSGSGNNNNNNNSSHARSDLGFSTPSDRGTPAASTPGSHPSSSSRGRGRGRRGGGGGRGGTGDRQQHTPAHSSSPWTGGRGNAGGGAAASPGRGPGGFRGFAAQSPGLAGSSPGAAGAGLGYGRGVAAVAACDRQLLLVGKDLKMNHVWELRVHPGQQFSSEWLAAVDRWTQNMTSGSSGQEQQQQGLVTPPPPPRTAPQAAAAAEDEEEEEAGPAPVPDEPAEVQNDDYDYEFDPEDDSGADSQGEGAQHSSSSGSSSSSSDDGSSQSDDDVYDMISYLRKVSLNDNDVTERDIDNVSTAATAGSSIAGTRASRWGRGSRSRTRGLTGSSKAAAGAGSSRRGGLGDDSAAGGSGDDTSGSGSWETDSAEEEEEEEQQQEEDQQDAAAAVIIEEDEAGGGREADRESDVSDNDSGSDAGDAGDADAMDAALTAAEETDLLGEPQQQQQAAAAAGGKGRHSRSRNGKGSSSTGAAEAASWSAAAAAAAAAAGVGEAAGAGGVAAGGGSSKPRKQRRGEAKRERWAQAHPLLVSMRLERQGLTDKEAELLATWYSSSAPAQHLSLAKLWLFDNALGDTAAAALAALLGPHTTELHLSHNRIGVEGAKALLAAVPLQRAKGVKPLWFRVEWNQVDEGELRRFIQEECAVRGLVVDIAQELPVAERTRSDSRGRELNLSWSLPWQSVHVQMPWLSCQRCTPAEAAVLQAAKAVWSRGAAAAGAAPGGGAAAAAAGSSSSSSTQRRQQQPRFAPAPAGSAAAAAVSRSGVSSRSGGVVAAAAVGAEQDDDPLLPLLHPPPPPPPPPPAKRATPAPPPPAGASSATLDPLAAGSCSNGSGSGSSSSRVSYQAGPLMLFIDTSAFLSMLGCPSNVAAATSFTLKLLQALAGSGRFGRGLAPEQQSFIVLADTVLKQLDSCKAAEGGVGGPVRRFLDKGLDDVGPKGLDFLTVLAAHEGEGLVVDRQAAVAGSRSPQFTGSTGQRSDLAIIEVALFFRTELMAAAAAAAGPSADDAAVPATPGGGGGAGSSGLGQQQQAVEAQPVILVTNDNAQLQLAKAHGLPAFKLAGASDFESQLSQLIKSGGDLTSSALRDMLAPAATAGLGAVAGRSLQDDFDGAVACLSGLVEAYQDLSGLLGRVSTLVAGAAPGEEAAVLQEVQLLLQEHQHVQPFEEAGVAGGAGEGVSVMEASMGNIAALERSLEVWEGRRRSRHTPSRVLKWAGSGLGRTPSLSS